MKKTLLSMLVLIFSASLLAQDAADTTKPWTVSGDFSLTFSQVSLTNWAAGGESSYSGNGLLNLNANYKKGKSLWENGLIMGYGFIKQEEDKWKKTDDRLEFNSKYGYQAKNKWYYAALLNFKSQFTPGYKDNHPDSAKISDFFAPAYLTVGIGMDYNPNEHLSLYISPATDRMTFVMIDRLATRYGLDPGENFRNQIGGLFRGTFKHPIVKNVDLQTTLELFTDYLNDPQNIDVLWDVLINMKINEFLSANLTTSLIYDHDVVLDKKDGKTGPGTQFKEVFGVGLSVKF
ncbi:MAG: DUF3078 domain-containing protein [Bacteroidetes bacterium]|nr:DUF3078 domain-containing protein [Bacteroidota bacterium]